MARAHNFIDREGENHISNEGCRFTIIKYFSKRNCTVQFEDGHIKEGVNYDHIKKGAVKNYYHPSVFGVGYLGIGIYKRYINNKSTQHYAEWKNMLNRAYSEKYKKLHPTYKDVTVCEEWKCFQIFAAWFEENWEAHMNNSWQLDKDLLFKGNKIYSPETCCFVHQEINKLFTKSDKMRGDLPIGVSKTKGGFVAIHRNNLGTHSLPIIAFNAYKVDKEEEIKRKADEWKPLIKPNVYEAMYAYKVEITD